MPYTLRQEICRSCNDTGSHDSDREEARVKIPTPVKALAWEVDKKKQRQRTQGSTAKGIFHSDLR